MSDYNNYIQPLYLNQLKNGVDDNRVNAESITIQDICAVLSPKFDVSYEFADLTVWSPDSTYNMLDRVYLDAVAFSASNTYNTNDLTLHNGNVYIALMNGLHGAWVDNEWALLGAQYKMFYVGYSSELTFQPKFASFYKPFFNYNRAYNVGEKVVYDVDKKVYTCKTASQLINHALLIQRYYTTSASGMIVNVAPDSTANAQLSFWDAGEEYVVPAGTLPTDTTYWVAGDSRNQIILNLFKAITIWRLVPMLAPQNIPKDWEGRYKEAMLKLDAIAEGRLTVDLKRQVQELENKRIFIGGNPKLYTSY